MAWTGIAIWCAALVVFLVLEAIYPDRSSMGGWIALVGIALGGCALVWEHRHRAAYRALGSAGQHADEQPASDVSAANS